MLRFFALYDANLDDCQVGTFSYDTDSKCYSMTISQDIPIEKLPLSLDIWVHCGKYELSHEETLRWIRGRICPPGRQNMAEIIRDNNLNGYDEFELLMITKARCGKDELYLVEK